LNICMLTSSFPRYPGDSAGIFVSDLSCYLSQRGCNVTILAPHDYGSKMSDIQGNLIVKRFRYFYPEQYQKLCYGSGIVKNIKTEPISLIQIPSFILSQFVSAKKILKNKKIDIIHAHWSLPQGLIGLLCKYFHNIPYIVTIHGSDIYGLDYPIISNLNRLVLRHVAVVCNIENEFGKYCFPQKAREIMACNTPLIGARVGAMQDILTGFPEEWLFKPNDKTDMARAIESRLHDESTNYTNIKSWTDIAAELEKYLFGVIKRAVNK